MSNQCQICGPHFIGKCPHIIRDDTDMSDDALGKTRGGFYSPQADGGCECEHGSLRRQCEICDAWREAREARESEREAWEAVIAHQQRIAGLRKGLCDITSYEFPYDTPSERDVDRLMDIAKAALARDDGGDGR